jgi:hypothetical protein
MITQLEAKEMAKGYEPKYTTKDFLQVVNDEPISVAEICRRKACGRNTAKKYLQALEAEKAIKRISIIGSINYAYIKCN